MSYCISDEVKEVRRFTQNETNKNNFKNSFRFLVIKISSIKSTRPSNFCLKRSTVLHINVYKKVFPIL